MATPLKMPMRSARPRCALYRATSASSPQYEATTRTLAMASADTSPARAYASDSIFCTLPRKTFMPAAKSASSGRKAVTTAASAGPRA